MNANLKIAVALAALVAAVVGVTVITQYTEGETKSPATGPSADAPAAGMPLVYDDAALGYNPFSGNYAIREFPGFFEVNKDIHWATYLLRNVGPQTVRLTARSRSCSACSQARAAVLSPAENQAVKVDTGAAAAVGGLFPRPPETDLYRRAEEGRLAWQPFDFEKPESFIEVPPAVDPDTPTWCVLQLGFEVKQTGDKLLWAEIGMATAAAKVPVMQKFAVAFFGDSAARVDPKSHDFGTLAEKSDPKTVELYYWSSTRPQARLAPPTVAGVAGDPFLAASAPVPLTAAELDVLAQRASDKAHIYRARSGYKFAVTLRRDNPTPTGPRELDIGPVERTVSVAGSDGTTSAAQVQLTGTVTGVVALTGGTAVELGDFASKVGTSKLFHLTGEKADLELEPVNGGTADIRDRNPPGVTVTAEGPPETKNGRRQWAFKVSVAANAVGGALTTQLLVFRVPATGQFIRIPLKGVAYNR